MTEPERIVDECAARHGLDFDDVMSKRRTMTVVRARRDAAKELRERYGWSYPELGRFFHRDHSTMVALLKGAA